MIQEYYLANSISDAMNALKNSQGQARVIAGGTDLLLDIAERKKQVAKLVDITRIPDLKEITFEENFIRIGAAVTHTQVAQSPLIKEHFPALACASGKVGSLQIRNISTLAGNIINAQPAADGAVALAALDAQVEVMDAEGLKILELLNLYEGVGKSSIDSHAQLVTGVKIPLPKRNQSSSFVRLEQRKALALPMLNVAVNVTLDLQNNLFLQGKIVMAPVGPGPVRARKSEEFLKNAAITPETINQAAQLAVKDANPRTSLIRGSREYRLDVLPVLVKRALENAVGQVKQKEKFE
ncbi:MAG: FAD binding domain-containing protein [Dehalobacterium sp.]